MEWNDNFKIGVPLIDAQHKELLNLLKLLQSALKKGGDKDILAKTIRALVDYTQSHFSDEEDYMQSINYPLLSEQRILHEKLIKEVKNILINLKNGISIKEISLMRFLNDWVCNHILEEDLKIAKFAVKNRKVDYSRSTEIKGFEDMMQEIVAKFQSLKKQVDNGLFSADKYQDECQKIIENQFDRFNVGELKGLSEALTLINYLYKKSLISDNDKMELNLNVVHKAISLDLLSKFEDKESSQRFLLNLKMDQIITEKDYRSIIDKGVL